MPDMATTDARFGLQPWGNILRARYYAIKTAPTLAFYHGDAVGHDGTSLSTPKMGTLPALEPDATPAAGGAAKLIGAVLALFDSNMDPTMYIAASAAGNGTIAGYALVADHPQQEFVIQEDGDTSSVVVANIGLNADLIATHAGSTKTGISGYELDSSSVNTTATLDLKIHGVHPEDTISAAGAAANYCRFLVSINTHKYDANIAGI